MFIQTKETPNPSSMQFFPGQDVLGASDPVAIRTSEEAAKRSPLADALFALPEVEQVFLGADFITVTKTDSYPWELLKPAVLSIVMDHFMAGLPVLKDVAPLPRVASGKREESLDEDDVSARIRELIDTRVRPAVAQDGGDIVFCSFEEGVVKLQLHGACSGCPSATMTLKHGVESMLRHYIPEVESVEAVPHMSEA